MGSKYGQKPLGSTKKSAKDALKTASERAIQKMLESIMKAASKSARRAPSKSTRPAQTDNISIQSIGISKEKSTYRTKYYRKDQFKFFKGCLPQILLGPFLNTLTHRQKSNNKLLMNFSYYKHTYIHRKWSIKKSFS